MTTTRQIYTLEDLYEQRFAPAGTLDLSKALASVQAYAEFLAGDAEEQLNLFTDETVQPRAIWGGTPVLAFDDVGEFGKGTPRMETAGQEVNFPLFKLDATVQASEEMWKRINQCQLREIMLGMEAAYSGRVRQEIAAAIFNNTIHTPAQDWINGDKTVLRLIQPFLNADGAAIPVSPNGTSFTSSSHTHYIGMSGSALNVLDVNYLVNHVAEHGEGQIILFADPAMPAKLATISNASGTNSYVAKTFSVLEDNSASLVARSQINPNGDRSNMSVGYWDGYEVFTRSWVPTNYIVAMNIGALSGKPLQRRIDPLFPGLRNAAEISDGVLRVKEQYFYMGFGAFNRAGGAVLDATTGSNGYTVPSGLVRK